MTRVRVNLTNFFLQLLTPGFARLGLSIFFIEKNQIMARITFVLLLAVLPFLTLGAQSCCNAGGLASCGSTGLLTGLRTNSAGLRFMQVPFQTTATAADKESYRDDFFLAEVSVRYQISPRWKLALQQPYRWNVREFPGET